jgi:hypothetical protein
MAQGRKAWLSPDRLAIALIACAMIAACGVIYVVVIPAEQPTAAALEPTPVVHPYPGCPATAGRPNPQPFDPPRYPNISRGRLDVKSPTPASPGDIREIMSFDTLDGPSTVLGWHECFMGKEGWILADGHWGYDAPENYDPRWNSWLLNFTSGGEMHEHPLIAHVQARQTAVGGEGLTHVVITFR